MAFYRKQIRSPISPIQEEPSIHVFLLKGGLISIAAANQRPDLFKGVILDAPLITLDNLPPAFVVCMTCFIFLMYTVDQIMLIQGIPGLFSSTYVVIAINQI